MEPPATNDMPPPEMAPEPPSLREMSQPMAPVVAAFEAPPVMARPAMGPPAMAPPASPSVLGTGSDRVATQPAGSAQSRGEAFEAWSDRLRGLVRDIRVEAEHVGLALDMVDAALVQTKADGPNPELDAAISAFVTAKTGHVAVVDQRFADLRAVFRACPRLYDAAGDEVAEVANLWNDALAAAPTAGATPDACRLNDPIARRALGEIAWHTAIVTVPHRVAQHLAQLRVGGQLKFDDSFADELPEPSQRTRMLEYLRAHPNAVSGIVDVEAGVIFAASPSSRRQLGSIVLLLGLVVLGIVIIRVATAGVPGLIAADWLFPSDRFADLVGAYLLLFVGAAVHIVIEAIKQQQRGGPGSFLAIDDWLLWLHVREVSNAVSIMSLWAVVFLLAAAYAAGIDRLAALFAGYSLDSVLGIAITRFDTFATSRVSTLEKTVSG